MTEVSNGHAAMATADRGPSVTVAEAAAKLAVSTRTVRRYVQAGTLPGELIRSDRGEEWRVDLAAVMALANRRPAAATDSAAGVTADTSDAGRGQPRSTSATRGQGSDTALLRALDLVADRDRRIHQLEQDRFELAGRLGYFQAQLEQAQSTIKALEAPKEAAIAPAAPRWPDDATPTDPPRPWWRFWGTG